MNESKIQVTKTGCISLLNSIFPEVEFDHEGSNDLVCKNVAVFLLWLKVESIPHFKDIHQAI